MSSSSWTTTRSAAGQVVVVEQAADRAAGLVHVGERPGQDHPPSGQPPLADSARARAPLPGDSRTPARSASSSSTIAPTLCRLPA